MTLLSTIAFDVDVLARSSIVHREDYSALGTDTMALFRREKIITPTGAEALVPIVSGSSFRGVLRRIGEQLTAAVLNYEGGLPVPAAHLLSNGGRLAKSARPLTDEQERTLKTLLPQIALFGGAASGRIMTGLLAVGKVLPEIAELAHILPRPPGSPLRPAVLGVADEAFTHLSDHRPSTAVAPRTDSDAATSPLGHFEVETLPAGTRLQTWARLSDATPTQTAFLIDVLTVFAERGHLGGRIAAGHGRISATITTRVLRGQLPDPAVDWAADLAAHRDEALAALTNLT
ncbi:RAMP superfamily CRISPR-associated protein [Mycobacteroides salmoniphilum]|uniref:CRISPR type III-associated protein domain-containing protein n=1 Tax=Mycobacteroides salmoniphilum TaxID=404941 RepID=A0A4R8T040_9MYCO|nr:RAMP superfamily CRISPR-associated protein [Mycobacteroides salmoniphilum]TEA09116.1 hypothetical protein CCUG60884_00285 [Mycobacteroides salmoniphilum]